jgi:hypothetical protein
VSLNEYRFRNVWSLDIAATRVFDALVDVARYPAWWPDVRSVSQVDDDTAEVACRALLPYSLVFHMRRAEQDERSGRLRVDLTGDLEGHCLGVVATQRPYWTRLEISQHVVVNKSLLRRLAPVARPLFQANHAAMMWRGQRGLRRYLLAGSNSSPWA